MGKGRKCIITSCEIIDACFKLKKDKNTFYKGRLSWSGPESKKSVIGDMLSLVPVNEQDHRRIDVEVVEYPDANGCVYLSPVLFYKIEQ